jgi:hypothetical protein
MISASCNSVPITRHEALFGTQLAPHVLFSGAKRRHIALITHLEYTMGWRDYVTLDREEPIQKRAC